MKKPQFKGLVRVDYQEEIAEKLGIQAVVNRDLFLIEKKYREIVLMAPTGAGKTVIEFLYKEKIFNQDPKAVLIHMTIGKGELHLQTAKKFKMYSNGLDKVFTTKDIPHLKKIKSHDIVCLNWESLNKTDKKTGEVISILSKEYHESQTTFPMLCQMIQDEGLNVYLVIDEDHESTQTIKSQAIIAKINPAVIIYQSATTKATPSTQADKFEVSREDVIKAELIVQGFIMQKGLKKDEKITREKIFELAYDTQKWLINEAKKESINYNPLIAIQIANGDLGEDQKKAIIKYFKSQGITEENGKLVLFLSEEKSEEIVLKNIDEESSIVKVLIFKQAIATGWDCPRAKVWVKLRDIKSMTFNTQTGGRFLRTVNQKYFKNNALNYAYMYTDEENYTYDEFLFKEADNYDKGLKIIIDSEFEKHMSNYSLVNEFSSREGNYGDYKADINELVFMKFINKHNLLKKDIKGNIEKLRSAGYIFSNKAERQMVGNSTVDIVDFYAQKQIDDSNKLTYQMSDEEVSLRLKDKFKNDMLHDFALERSWKPVVASFNRIALYLFESEPIFKFHKFLLHTKNWELFVAETARHMDKYRKMRKENGVTNHKEFKNLIIASERTYNSSMNQVKKVNKSLYKSIDNETSKSIPCCVVNSQDPQTETNFYHEWNSFAGELNANVRIHRNGKNTDQDLRISYNHPTSKKDLGFHPDILIIEALGQDNFKTGIFDIKHATEVKKFNENSEEVAKHNAQIQYMIKNSTESHKLYGGMIVQLNGVNGMVSFKVFEGSLDLKAFNKGDFSSGKDLEDYIKEKHGAKNQEKVA